MAFPLLNDAAIATRVRRLINEPVALRHSDTDIAGYYDMGAQFLTQITLGYEEAGESFQLTAEDYDYAFTTVFGGTDNCIKIEAVVYMGAGDADSSSVTAGLIKIPPRLWHQLDSTTSGAPKYWTAFNDVLYIWPTPAVAQSGHYVHVFYYKTFTDLSGTNNATTLPDYLQEIPLWYAVGRALEIEGKYAQAQQYFSYFWNMAMFHRQDRLYKPVDSKDMMSLPDNTQFV